MLQQAEGRLVGGRRQQGYPEPAQGGAEGLALLLPVAQEALPRPAVRRVQFAAFAPVGHRVVARPRQLGFQRVGALDGGQLGVLGQFEQVFPGALPGGAAEIADHEQAAAGPRDTAQVGQHRCKAGVIGRAVAGQGVVEAGDLGQQGQHGLAAAPRADFPVAGIVEDETADPVAAVEGAPGQQARQLARQYRFETVAGAEEHAAALVDHHQHGAFPLLAKQLGVRIAGARGDAPVDRADIVTGLVGADLLEIDAAAPEVGLVGPGQCAQRAAAVNQLELPAGKRSAISSLIST